MQAYKLKLASYNIRCPHYKMGFSNLLFHENKKNVYKVQPPTMVYKNIKKTSLNKIPGAVMVLQRLLDISKTASDVVHLTWGSWR